MFTKVAARNFFPAERWKWLPDVFPGVFNTHLTYSRARIFTLEAFRNEVMGHIVNYFPLLRRKEKKKPCREGLEDLYLLSKYLMHTECKRCVFEKDTIQVNIISVK